MTPQQLSALARDPSRRDEFIEAVPYMRWYEKIDFRAHPELYRIGRGEQGVLMAEPFKSEIVPYWKFKTVALAEESSKTIEAMFHRYLSLNEFPGADMARKFLQMGYTRARRYANHPSGRKYHKGTRDIIPLAEDNQTSEKAEAARIFRAAYDRVRVNPTYLKMKKDHQDRFGEHQRLYFNG